MSMGDIYKLSIVACRDRGPALGAKEWGLYRAQRRLTESFVQSNHTPRKLPLADTFSLAPSLGS